MLTHTHTHTNTHTQTHTHTHTQTHTHTTHTHTHTESDTPTYTQTTSCRLPAALGSPVLLRIQQSRGQSVYNHRAYVTSQAFFLSLNAPRVYRGNNHNVPDMSAFYSPACSLAFALNCSCTQCEAHFVCDKSIIFLSSSLSCFRSLRHHPHPSSSLFLISSAVSGIFVVLVVEIKSSLSASLPPSRHDCCHKLLADWVTGKMVHAKMVRTQMVRAEMAETKMVKRKMVQSEKWTKRVVAVVRVCVKRKPNTLNALTLSKNLSCEVKSSSTFL